MKTALLFICVGGLAAAGAYGAPGDVIRTFSVPGQPGNGIRGLAFDPSDGDVWAAGPHVQGDVRFGKFDAVTGGLVGSWASLPGAVWNFDIGFGYQVGGTKYLVVADKIPPRVRLYTTNGSFVGTMADPFAGGYDEGCACDWGGTTLWLTNSYAADVKRWGGGGWTSWAVVPEGRPEGVATGWGRVFVGTDYPDHIYEYDKNTGSVLRTITPPNWGYDFVGVGLGRVDAFGSEESVFIACYRSDYVIAEVSVGDVTAASATPASLGKVKALFK